jgi:uncharacterized protein, YhcH/YjgK/YiaL family
MIIDSLENAPKYFSAHPLFKKAFTYLQQTNLQEATGKHEIAEGLKASFTNDPGKTKAEKTGKAECHREFIDIQVCIKGKETMGWKPLSTCGKPNGGYNAEKDIQFFYDEPDTFFDITNGQFVIFFPEDVHLPMLGNGNIQKVVIKVKI